MRLSLLPLLFALAACPQGSLETNAVGDDEGDKGPAPGQVACAEDSDCQLASRTCCGCKTFSLAMSDPKLDACMDDMCPPQQMTCPVIRAACVENQCTIECLPVDAASSCAEGFAVDSVGCLIDACAPVKSECMSNDDCVKTRADCCGCARGGDDTAVPKTSRAAFDAALGCNGTESCPEESTCKAAETAQCAQGTCKLIAGGLPADACGRPDLPPCPTGTKCTLNASDPANMHGVGVCR